MGPFHWLLHTVGVPVWVAQRLWLGTLLVLAGTGVWWCARLLGLSRPGATAAAVLYQLSPYVLLYVPRTSVILLPWAGLGWLLGLTVLAARRGGWRYPAAAALVVATMAGTNATAVALVGLAPALWLVWAMWGSREIQVGRGLAAAGRIAVLSLATSRGLDRGDRHRGPLRRRRPGVQRDPLGGQQHVARLGGRPRAGLLAVLRRRRHRALEQRLAALPHRAAADRPRALPGPRRRGRGGAGALGQPRLRRLVAARRRRRQRRRPSAGRPVAVRPPAVRLGPEHARPRPPEQHPRPPPGRARAGAGGRRRRRRAGRPTAGDGHARRGGRRGAGGPQPARALERDVCRWPPTAPVRRAGSLDGRGGALDDLPRRQPRARAAGGGVRRLPLGHDERRHPPRPHVAPDPDP